MRTAQLDKVQKVGAARVREDVGVGNAGDRLHVVGVAPKHGNGRRRGCRFLVGDKTRDHNVALGQLQVDLLRHELGRGAVACKRLAWGGGGCCCCCCCSFIAAGQRPAAELAIL